jgi:broad specificity phosphatase PhoE
VSFVRHGLVHNPDKVYYGRLPNFRLGDEGLAQAKLTGEHLAAHKEIPDAIFCSPMLRARQTAGAIMAQLLDHNIEMKVTMLPTLNEVHSQSDGKTQEELQQIGWHKIYADESGGEFETFSDVFARIEVVIKMLAQSVKEDSHVVCVSHGDICMAAHVYARGLPGTMEGYQRLKAQDFYPDTASVTTLDLDKHGAVRSHSYVEAGTGEQTHTHKKAKI